MQCSILEGTQWNYLPQVLYFGLHRSERLPGASVGKLSGEQEATLTTLARSKRTSVRLAQRAQIVLLAAQGLIPRPALTASTTRPWSGKPRRQAHLPTGSTQAASADDGIETSGRQRGLPARVAA